MFCFFFYIYWNVLMIIKLPPPIPAQLMYLIIYDCFSGAWSLPYVCRVRWCHLTLMNCVNGVLTFCISLNKMSCLFRFSRSERLSCLLSCLVKREHKIYCLSHYSSCKTVLCTQFWNPIPLVQQFKASISQRLESLTLHPLELEQWLVTSPFKLQ